MFGGKENGEMEGEKGEDLEELESDYEACEFSTRGWKDR